VISARMRPSDTFWPTRAVSVLRDGVEVALRSASTSGRNRREQSCHRRSASLQPDRAESRSLCAAEVPLEDRFQHHAQCRLYTRSRYRCIPSGRSPGFPAWEVVPSDVLRR